jgi:hypothetical protein
MTTFDRYLRLALFGWAVVAVFGITVIFVADEPAAGLMFAGIAAGMGAWVILRASRVALVVSLVLGILQSLEQAGYCVADVGAGSVASLCGDLVGLAGGLCVVVGSVAALRTRARATKPVSGVATH